MHEHVFEPALIVHVFGVATWLRVSLLEWYQQDYPTPGAYLCECGEQGVVVA